MGIYGNILFDHKNFQDFIVPDAPSNTRDIVADLLLQDGPLCEKFNDIINELNKKINQVNGHRLLTDEEATKLANLNNYDDSQVYKKIEEEIIARAEEDKVLDEKINNLNNSLQDTNLTIQDLIGTAQEKDELISLIQSLKDQLTQDTLVLLINKVSQMEKILFADELIIGDVESTFQTVGKPIEIYYDGGMVD